MTNQNYDQEDNSDSFSDWNEDEVGFDIDEPMGPDEEQIEQSVGPSSTS